MSNDDRETTADVLAVVDTNPPLLAKPEILVDGLRYLQRRIPEFTHLSLQEKRSHARAANLHPEFIESGLQAAEVWPYTKAVVQRDARELRQEQEEARRWDQVIVEMRAITDGIEAANLKRKHRLGQAILQIYRTLATQMDVGRPEHVPMRPYYENMKSAYMRTQRFRKRKS
jgi:hypothetical protein